MVSENTQPVAILFHIWIRQETPVGILDGYLSQSGDELVHDEANAGAFTLDAVSMIILGCDYEGCDLLEYKATRI